MANKQQFIKAKGTKATLINNIDEYIIRVYNSDKSFVDYELAHNDLEIQILDDDAEFDTVNIVLDHSCATLGRE